MGVSRDSRHKRRASGARMPVHKKKRAFEKARASAFTKLIETTDKDVRVRPVRVRGGNKKYRALRLNEGNFSWGSQQCTCKAKILAVRYNASNNELVRRNILVKNAIVQIEATPFKNFFLKKYGTDIGKNKKTEVDTKQSANLKAKILKRAELNVVDQHVQQQFGQGKLYAIISSRPGQSGRADGYILEGNELAFYQKKIEHKKK